MKIDRFEDKEYWTVTKPTDLDGWVLIFIEDWKPGVKRLHVRTPSHQVPAEFRMLYCPDDLAPGRQHAIENLK